MAANEQGERPPPASRSLLTPSDDRCRSLVAAVGCRDLWGFREITGRRRRTLKRNREEQQRTEDAPCTSGECRNRPARRRPPSRSRKRASRRTRSATYHTPGPELPAQYPAHCPPTNPPYGNQRPQAYRLRHLRTFKNDLTLQRDFVGRPSFATGRLCNPMERNDQPNEHGPARMRNTHIGIHGFPPARRTAFVVHNRSRPLS